MIEEVLINTLPTPVFKINKKKEPRSINLELPELFFSTLIIGSKNSGKTYAVTSLLKMFEQNPIYDINGNELQQRIILFSPTALNQTNNIFQNLKYLNPDDIHLEYSDELLENILKEIKEHVKEVEDYEKYLKILYKFEKSNKSLTDDEYWLLYQYNFEMIEPKQHIITHFVFDDLIGDKNTFKKSRDGGLVKFLLKHRHLYTNIFITTQYINAIQPIIKNNIDIFCLFKYANLQEILKKFYPVVSGVMLEGQFEELYKHATNEKFNFLNIFTKSGINIRKNWNVNLTIK